MSNTFVPRFSRFRPKNKNTLLGPFNVQAHQNYSTTWAGLWAIPYDVQGAEATHKSSSYHCVSAKKKSTKNIKTLFCERISVVGKFLLFMVVLGT